jgi:hypothetical protein
MPIQTIEDTIDNIQDDQDVRVMLRAEFGGPQLTGVDMKHPFIPETVVAVVYSSDGFVHIPKSVRVDGDWVRVKLAVPSTGGFNGRMVVYGVPK